MGNNFARAMTTGDVRGENDMPTNSTSMSLLTDLYFKQGASRAKTEGEILDLFIPAWGEYWQGALLCLFYNRDVRGGQGERRFFRVCFRWICQKHPEIAAKVLHFIPQYGRWDDVLAVTYGTPVEKIGFALCQNALRSGDKLCGKWMPRENKSGLTLLGRGSAGRIAKSLAEFMEISMKQYRLLLSGNSETIEQLMCSGKWGKIDFNKVPSKAIFLYRKALNKHEGDRYQEWLKALEKGEPAVKINAGAIYPHELVQGILQGGDRQVDAQWKALPDFVKSDMSFLPIVDVSGSMNTGDGLPMRVAIALGLYLSERNKSVFKDCCITFSQTPAFHYVTAGTLSTRVSSLRRADWGMNTNLEAVFELILSQAQKAGLSQSDMPTHIIILSDMQFDACVGKTRVTARRFLGEGEITVFPPTAFRMIDAMYTKAGYVRPNVVFWNLRDSIGVPVHCDTYGTALVSGFSPSIMQDILGGDFTPIRIIQRTLGRYNKILEALL